MMSRATEALAFPGRCGFCLNLLDDLVDVRILPCKHEACTACLRAEVQLRHKVVCFQCKEKYEDIEIDEFMTRKTKPRFKPHSEERFVCDTKNCEQPADKYCVPCQHLFCSQHKQVHDSLFSHEELDIEEYNVKKNKFILKDCSRHSDGKINMACEKCRVLLCDKCISVNESLNCGDSTTERYVVNNDKLRSGMNEKIGELRIRDTDVEDILKHNFQTCDQLLEESRNMYEQIDQTAVRMKVRIDGLAEKLKSDVRNFTVKVKSDVDELNGNLLEHSKSSEILKSEMYRLTTGEIADVVINQRMLERAAAPPSVELSELRYKPQSYLLLETEDETSLPLKFTASYPTALKLTRTIETESWSRTVTHSYGGQLLYGSGSRVIGLDFEYQACDSDDDSQVTSLCLSGGELFILLSDTEKDYNSGAYIYKVNLKTQKTTILAHLKDQHDEANMAVTENFILVASYFYKCVKVYDRHSCELKFDIRHEAIRMGNLEGIEVLNDGTAIVCTYHESSTINNFTIDSTSELIWSLDDLPYLHGINIDRKRNVIFVSNHIGSIYCISAAGELLQTIEANQNVYNLSFHEDKLAVATGSTIEIYQCDFTLNTRLRKFSVSNAQLEN